MAYAVWSDLDITINTDGPLEYNIWTTEDQQLMDNIYTGIATPKPSEENVKIRLSEYAKNVCNSDIETDGELFSEDYSYNFLPNYHCDLEIIYTGSTGNVTSRSFSFCNDYDYNGNYYITSAVRLISNPIYNTYGEFGYIWFSVYNGSNSTVNVDIVNETKSITYSSMELEPYKATMFQLFDAAIGTYKILYNDTKVLHTFEVVPNCHRYRLHYINANGGYDSMEIEGLKDKRSDEFNFEYYKARGHNSSFVNPQMNKFKVDVTPKWALTTGWLNDTQSLKMYNLFTSQKIWLEDTSNGKIYPVYISDKTLDYKTYTNNGKKKISYNINVTSCNTIVKL